MNSLIRDAVLNLYEPGDVIWIHDYHLMALPELVRRCIKDAYISFFLHTPFQFHFFFKKLESYSIGSQLLKGLLYSNSLFFQTEDYKNEFLKCISLKIDTCVVENDSVCFLNHKTEVAYNPISIDYDYINNLAISKLNENKDTQEVKKLLGNKVVLSVDRLDPSKGILNKLKAIDKFLSKNKNWIGRVTFLLVVAPSRENVQFNLDLLQTIKKTVNTINSKYKEDSWMPIDFHYKIVSFKELIYLYLNADVLLITSLLDGINLISKEYIAARIDQTGVLILSKYAGASKDLTDCLLVDPLNINDISDKILHSLELSDEDQKSCMIKMQNYLKQNDILRWGQVFLDEFDTVSNKIGSLQ